MGCNPFSYTLATGVFTRIIKNKTLTGFPGLPADPRLPRTPDGPCHSIKGRDTTSFRFKNDHFLSYPEFHPITSSRYYSLSNVVTEGVITTRSNRMTFRLFLSARLRSRLFFRSSICATMWAAGTNKISGWGWIQGEIKWKESRCKNGCDDILLLLITHNR